MVGPRDVECEAAEQGEGLGPVFLARAAHVLVEHDVELPMQTVASRPEELHGTLELRIRRRLCVTFGDWRFPLSLRFSSKREDWVQALILAGLGVSFVAEGLLPQPGIQMLPICQAGDAARGRIAAKLER